LEEFGKLPRYAPEGSGVDSDGDVPTLVDIPIPFREDLVFAREEVIW